MPRERCRRRRANVVAVRSRGRGQQGQATVELALVLPLLMLLIWLGLEASLLLRDQVLVTHAAREAARAMAVGADVGAARVVAQQRSGLGEDLAIDGTAGAGAGEDARVRASVRERTRLPLLGRLVPSLEVSSVVVMRVEAPP